MNMECRGFGKVLTRHHKMLNGLAGASLITLILKLKLDFPINESPGLLIWMAANAVWRQRRKKVLEVE